MKLLKNSFFITADPDSKKTLPIIGLNGEPLKLATQFDPYRYSTQIGEIYEVPADFSTDSIDSHTLKKGDIIWFHHHVCQPKNLWLIKGQEYFACGYKQVWAKVENGALIPMNDWLFVAPILENESDMFTESGFQLHDEQQNLPQVGIAFSVSEYAKKMGVQPGDKIHFIENADYEIEIDEKQLWRMKTSAVMAVEREGKIIPLADKILIKEDERPDRVFRSGLILPLSEQPKQLYGIVAGVGENAGVVKEGEHVCFFHGMFTRMYFQNEEYAIIKKENIVYVEA